MFEFFVFDVEYCVVYMGLFDDDFLGKEIEFYYVIDVIEVMFVD